MFLLSSLLVLTVAYWLCAVLSALVFTSRDEDAVPIPVRIGLGFILSITYFSAAWELMSIRQAWSLALLLIALRAASLRGRSRAASWRELLKGFVRDHLRGYAMCAAAGLLFFAPLLISQKYGPFTEGGGDVSIYADTAKYLSDHRLTLKGAASDTVTDAVASLKQALDTTIDRHILNILAAKRYSEADRGRANPPDADSPVYRLLVLRSMSPFLYAPYGQFYFLATDTNYHVYYGIQAFIYGLLLASAWYLFGAFGLPSRLLFTGFVAFSHSLISIFYNTYSAQTISILISMLVLCVVPRIRLFSWAAFRAYAVPLVYLWISYVHYLSIVGPLVLVAAAAKRFRGRSPVLDESPERSRAPWRRASRVLALGIFGLLFGVLMVSGYQTSAILVKDLLESRMSIEPNVFMGDRIAPFSIRWLSFMFGFISQQHLQPFAVETPWVLKVIDAGVWLGVAGLALGAVAVLKWWWSPRRHGVPRDRLYLALYVVMATVIATHLYLAQAYVYTQAKGAQNILVLLFALLVLPLALLLGDREPGAKPAAFTIVLGVTLLSFAGTLAIPRMVYGIRMARSQDRVTILEPSYFAQARLIRQQDPGAFVLFEPRKSADLYMSNQSLAGGRIASTRHLALTRLNFEAKPPVGERIDASVLIRQEDIPHLWTLSASSADSGRTYEWKARRVVERESPGLYLFADDYERDYGERQRSPEARDVGIFSYVRNGSAMVFMPAGEGGSLEVKLAPRDASDHDRLANEVSGRVARGEFGSGVRVHDDGAFVTLAYGLPKAGKPRLVPVARFSGEYWLNVRLDGKDLVAKDGAAPGHAQVAGELLEGASGVRMLVTWSGLATPGKEDWVGVFPAGGDDASRLAFAFLGAREHGTLTLPVPGGSMGAKYEVRLFRAGSWNSVAIATAVHGQDGTR
jgi:hypothetical protein